MNEYRHHWAVGRCLQCSRPFTCSQKLRGSHPEVGRSSWQAVTASHSGHGGGGARTCARAHVSVFPCSSVLLLKSVCDVWCEAWCVVRGAAWRGSAPLTSMLWSPRDEPLPRRS